MKNFSFNVVTSVNDIALVRQITEQAFSTTPDAGIDEWLDFNEMLAEINVGRGLGLIALEDSKPIGIMYAQQESPVNGQEGREKWVVIIAAVIPEATGSGVGTSLLVELESRVADLGGVKMFIFTNKDDEKVIHFYKKNGYTDAGWIRDYQYGKGNSAVFLLKHL